MKIIAIVLLGILWWLGDGFEPSVQITQEWEAPTASQYQRGLEIQQKMR